MTYEGFAKDLKPGNTVLVDDGLIGMEVISTTDTEVVCKVLNNGDLGENKGVNLPGVSIKLPALAEKDKADLVFGCEQGVDFIAASFIRKKEDVLAIREHLKATVAKTSRSSLKSKTRKVWTTSTKFWKRF